MLVQLCPLEESNQNALTVLSMMFIILSLVFLVDSLFLFYLLLHHSKCVRNYLLKQRTLLGISDRANTNYKYNFHSEKVINLSVLQKVCGEVDFYPNG